MMSLKKLLSPLGFGVVIVVGLIFTFKSFHQPVQKEKIAPSQTSNSALPGDNTAKIKVARVVDGDTIEIAGGQKLRYIGMDTPETVDPRRPVGCFGKEASDENKKLVEGKEVVLEKDVSETDKYGRLLRYVYLSDGTFINEELVRQGYAKVLTYPPDVRYTDRFLRAEREAREAKRGLWGSCSVLGISTQSSILETGGGNSGCMIKGNISSGGEKIYHLPGQRYYDKTVVDTSKGEKWFCNEDEAVSAGWRRSKV